MAQPIPRKSVPREGSAAYILVHVDDAVKNPLGEEGEAHGEDNDDDQEPTSCFGHFDRLDIEYTPKPTTEARVHVYHDKHGPWCSIPLQQHAGVSRRWDSVVTAADAAAAVKSTTGRSAGKMKRQRTASSEVEEPGRQMQRDSRTPTPLSPSSSHSPRRVLKRLDVSRIAERPPIGEDPYISGRLAAASVLMMREGLFIEAEKMGVWSVELVGKEVWDKMVEYHGSAPRLETDDRNWVVLLLEHVGGTLRLIDEARAAELRGMMSEWQDMGVFPGRSVTPEALR